MELEFDKEIDTLLRNARPDDGGRAGGAVSPHLDADSIAAFAENALPETSRLGYTAHLADCDDCRKILSNVISFNSESVPEPETVAAPAIAAAAEPWYRRLFLFPNLAYVMGSLVLMFSGLLGYMMLQNTGSESSMEVSQIEDAPSTASGPNAGEEPSYPSAAANSMMNAANTMSSAANTMANAASLSRDQTAGNANSSAAGSGRALDAPLPAATPQPSGLLDGITAAESRPPPPPAPVMKERDRAEDKVEMAAKDAKAKSTADETRELSSQNEMRKQLPRSDRGSAKSAGPQRNQQNSFPNLIQRNESEVAVTQTVAGRNFERKQGVWIDTAYRGQAAETVRRGTEQYRKLDGGLRSIGNSLDGTVITVWKNRAYRIQ